MLALLEAEPLIRPEEIAARLRVDVLEVEAACRELAEAGLFGE